MAQRETFLSVRMNASERKKLNSLCNASGLTPSIAVRKLIVGAQIKANNAREIKQLYTEINHIGNNINQIARSVNAGIATPETAAEAVFLLRKVYDAMERIADE